MKKSHTWREKLARYSHAEIVAVLGCPHVTAYSWTREKDPREPPPWLQRLILDALERHRAKAGPRVADE